MIIFNQELLEATNQAVCILWKNQSKLDYVGIKKLKKYIKAPKLFLK